MWSGPGLCRVLRVAGYADFEAQFPIQSLEAAVAWSFTRVPLSVDGSNVVFENPSGELLDGSGSVTGCQVVLTQALLHISNGEFESITSLSLDALREALTP